MTRTNIERLPIFACAGFILFLFLANIWNYAVERDWPKLRIRSASPLAGVAKPKPAPWTLDAFLAGETQKAVSNNLGRSLPVFPISVRAKNQLVFSLFGESAASGVVIGRNGELFEQIYIDEYCRRGDAPDPEHIESWAEAIQATQALFESAGKSFVYLVSPSKAARYADDLPPLVCPARAAKAPDKMLPYLSALRGRGVRFVDGPGLITARQADFATPLFPRGGTHWGSLGAALALREITLAPTASPIGAFSFEASPAPEAMGSDRDLVDLLNLLSPDVSYPTSVITRAGAPGDCARPPRVLALGGSFLNQILIAATQAPCPPDIDYWFYMRTENLSVELGHFRRPPGDVSKGQRQSTDAGTLAENIRAADLVILEENEANISFTSQVTDLRKAAGLLRQTDHAP